MVISHYQEHDCDMIVKLEVGELNQEHTRYCAKKLDHDGLNVGVEGWRKTLVDRIWQVQCGLCPKLSYNNGLKSFKEKSYNNGF